MSTVGTSPVTRSSLKSFLAKAKNALASPASQRPSPLTFVIGNESADLDSLCSAVLLAYLRTHTPPHHTLHIPVSNLPRPDLALRPELGAVLGPAGLRPDDLITLSDLPPRGALRPRDTRWLLVDHNAPTGELAERYFSGAAAAPGQAKGKEKEEGAIVGCIDHHDDEGVVPRHLPAGQPRVIERCGSCASLVVEHCREAWEALAREAPARADGARLAVCDDGTPAAECDAHLGRLALAPILVDTAALGAPDRTTAADVRAAEWVEAKMLASHAGADGSAGANSEKAASRADGYDRAAFYAALTRLKTSLRGLSYRDVLRKDYKRWSEGADAPIAVGISSVPRSLADALREAGADDKEDRASFLAALRAWAEEQRLDVAAVMTVFPAEGGGIARELLVWGVNGRGAGVVGEFARRFGARLGLETWEGGEMDEGGEEPERGWRLCWRQGDVSCSRKQVAPMLREAMRVVARL
ncbi:hypothetical protein VTJ83DRAFT_4438 [Remersonia thermophila]|uniref:DHHA2 domain-containing protein n=1 Tax=Remersonia thermophila TaxID=72144 RepID=A0ABR4D9X9_9PEZI